MIEDTSPLNSPGLIDAIRIWSGRGQFSWPNRDEARLRLRIGTVDAERLLPVIKRLETDFYSSDAHLIANDLNQMGNLAVEHFRRLRPDVADEIVEVLRWCYTFDWK